MKKISTLKRSISIVLSACLLLASCSSTTMIQSSPSSAKVYMNGEFVGTTPYTHQDTKIVGSTTIVKLEKEGYATLNTNLSRDEEVDVGAVIGGVFLLVPFLWTMKYKPTHMYELQVDTEGDLPEVKPNTTQIAKKSKAERLRELKQLLDEKLITQEDYDKQKAKILEESEK